MAQSVDLFSMQNPRRGTRRFGGSTQAAARARRAPVSAAPAPAPKKARAAKAKTTKATKTTKPDGLLFSLLQAAPIRKDWLSKYYIGPAEFNLDNVNVTKTIISDGDILIFKDALSIADQKKYSKIKETDLRQYAGAVFSTLKDPIEITDEMILKSRILGAFVTGKRLKNLFGRTKDPIYIAFPAKRSGESHRGIELTTLKRLVTLTKADKVLFGSAGVMPVVLYRGGSIVAAMKSPFLQPSNFQQGDQVRDILDQLNIQRNPRRGSRRYRAASPYYGILGRPGKTSATAAARRLRDNYSYPFSLQKDGIEGYELSYKMIPGADTFDDERFQYALGYTKPGGEAGVYSRGASRRGTFGGWRWEMDPSKLLKQNPTPDQLLQSSVNIQIFATRNERARAFAESLPNGALKKALLSGLSKTMNALMADVTIFDMPDYMTTIRHILARQIPNKPKWSAARAQLLGFFDDRESNPSVKAIYQKFNGRPSRRSRNVAAPAGTPRDLAQLGRLRTIKTVDGRTWRFPGDRAPFLAADSRGRLHVVGGQYRANPAGEDCGEIDLIEYQTRKPHLGHHRETIYYHKLGEDTGERPTLEITPEGELVIHGGAYRIESDGIHN